ncbi:MULTISPECIES: response regulator [unclassified Carboxylicivirga]|uniref:response regulator n=1 Tax=Carboxylicivirga TaxID=1628153 RepID=UPI003D334EEC
MRKVLVVEDDKFISAIISMFLRDLGHELIGKCDNGDDAVDLCHRLRPDVVLMDIHLEGEMDGIQTAEQLRRELEIPVIYVSSDTSSEVIKRAIVSNSYAYLVKPVNKKELGIAIDLAYYKHRVDQEQKERERGYRQFISEASLPLMILHEGRIQYLNNLALDLFKTHYMEDVLMMPYLDFVHTAYKEEVESVLQAFHENGSGFSSKSIAMHDVHGQSFYAQVSGSSIIFNKKKSLQVTLVDNTAAIYARKRNDCLLGYMSRIAHPYFITDASGLIKAVAPHPLFEGLALEGQRLQQLRELFESIGTNVIFKNGLGQTVFAQHVIHDAAGRVYEIMFMPQVGENSETIG